MTEIEGNNSNISLNTTTNNNNSSGEMQSRTISELTNDIKDFKKRERSYLVQLHFKDKEIRALENQKSELIKSFNSKSNNKSNNNNLTSHLEEHFYLNNLMLKEFKYIKNLIKQKDDLLQAKEEEINSLTINPNR